MFIVCAPGGGLFFDALFRQRARVYFVLTRLTAIDIKSRGFVPDATSPFLLRGQKKWTTEKAAPKPAPKGPLRCS
ncbi:MAG: hypothetical protein R3240_02995 [Gammaproteobacteria bacterium]|nr:hypothetical protein [Gammaproteobacteria bacterium]